MQLNLLKMRLNKMNQFMIRSILSCMKYLINDGDFYKLLNSYEAAIWNDFSSLLNRLLDE